MTTQPLIGIIIIVSFFTFLFRYIPFLLKSKLENNRAMQVVKTSLPASIMLILVLYTLNDIKWLYAPYGLCEITSILLIIVLHLKYRNTLLSISLGVMYYIYISYTINILYL